MLEQYEPLVSILIPAYSPEFFSESLASALNQSYERTEILIGDDSGREVIGEIVARFSGHGNFHKIRLHKNERNLGMRPNYLNLFKLARGEFVKYLNDDDLLDDRCIETMMQYFAQYQDRLTLVTSKRDVIDHLGRRLPDTPATESISVWQDSPLIEGEYFYLNGNDLGNLVLTRMANMIGEPTTALFRKSDLEGISPDIFSINGSPAQANLDVAMWLNLLSKGDAIYVNHPLSLFRTHPGQGQQNVKVLFHCYIDWYNSIENARKLGFLRNGASYQEAVSTVRAQLVSCGDSIAFSEEQKAFLGQLAQKLGRSPRLIWIAWSRRASALLKSGRYQSTEP